MKKTNQIGTITALILLLTQSAFAISIGVSPGRAQYENVLPGGYAERVIAITTNSEDPFFVDYVVEGDVQEWIRIEPSNESFPVSQSSPQRLTIIAEPPNDIANGSYTGQIQFITSRLGSATGRAGGAVRAAVSLLINIEVVNHEIAACRAGGFEISDAEVDFPLTLGMTIINEGNVRVRPNLNVDIWDQFQENLIVFRQITGDEVLPTTTRRTTKELREDLEVGQYWAQLSAEECQASELHTFSIVEKGAIADTGVLHEITNKVWAVTGEPVEIKAIFQNTGPRTVFARFKGTIKRDDEIIEVIETNELEVPSLGDTNFVSFFTPERSGRYLISGRVTYNKKLTFEKGSVLNVNPSEESGRDFPLSPLLIVYLAIIVTILFIIRRIILERKR